jgi:single-stranded DNA-binding protein
MIGITACFTGRLGKDAEIRNARDGAPWASFPVAVDTKPGDETAATWVRVAVFGNTVIPLTPRLRGPRSDTRGTGSGAFDDALTL